jgi:NAD(P)-dependent dehydrogenase (short-subunit alcohol dehydrogenase family)
MTENVRRRGVENVERMPLLNNSNSFTNYTCIVTGATSGIGLAIASELATNGARLVLVGRNQQKGLALQESFKAQGTNSLFIKADISDLDAPARIVDQTLNVFGTINVLINNAGILLNGTAMETTDAQWDQVIDVNLSAVFRLCRAVIPHMIERGKGSIVNVASDWALMGAKGAIAYCVSKAALGQLSRCLALDHAHHGIRVNAICPGDTDTPMLDLAFPGNDRNWKLRTLAANIPMGRLARVDEVAKVAAFIASDDASFITGALIPIDGGTSAQ